MRHSAKLLAFSCVLLSSAAYGAGSTAPGIVQGNSTATPGHCWQVSAAGVAIDSGATCGTGASGVSQSTGTASQVLVNGDTASHTGATTYSLPAGVSLGTPGSAAGSLGLAGATSGTATVASPATGGGTLTLPAGTDTLVGRATTDTLTNKSVSGSTNTITNIPLTTAVTGVLPVANGGSGTSTPGIVAGTNVTVTGSWPNQTVNSSGGSGITGWPASGNIPISNGSNSATALTVGSGLSLSGTTLSATGSGTGNALFGTTSGNVSGDVVSMSNTTTGVQDSGVAIANLAQQSNQLSKSAGFTVTAAQFLAQNPLLATASLTETFPATSTLNANGFQIIQAKGNSVVTIQPNAADCVFVSGTASCGTTGASYALSAGFGALVQTDAAGTLIVSPLPPASSGSSGFPITLGSTSIASGSTTTTVAGLALTNPTLNTPDLISTPLVNEIANAGTTGTTLHELAKLTGVTSAAVLLGTSDTQFQGIVVGGAGTTGSAQIARVGQTTCTFDNTTVAGDWVVPSTTIGGDCHDTGSAALPAQQVVGRVLTTNAGGAGTYLVDVSPQNPGAGAGGGAVSSVNDNGLGTMTVTPTTGAVTVALNLSNSNDWTAQQAFSGAGVLSNPSVVFNGSLFTGGTGTTTWPNVILYDSGAANVTTWNTAGTYLGFNAKSAFTGNYIDAHLNGGSSVFKVSSTGSVTAGSSYTGTLFIPTSSASPGTGMNLPSTGALGLYANGSLREEIDSSGNPYFLSMTSATTAQTGTVCILTTSTPSGELTYDPTNTCLSSLEELKDNHGGIGSVSALRETMKLSPFWGSWKKTAPSWLGGDHAVQPFLGAHAVEKVDPRLASYDSKGKLRSVRYQEMVAFLVADVQGLQEEIAGLFLLIVGLVGWNIWLTRKITAR